MTKEQKRAKLRHPISRDKIADITMMSLPTLREKLYELGIYHSKKLTEPEVDLIREKLVG